MTTEDRRELQLADLVGAEPMASGYVKLLNGRVAHQREYLPLLLPLIANLQRLRAGVEKAIREYTVPDGNAHMRMIDDLMRLLR